MLPTQPLDTVVERLGSLGGGAAQALGRLGRMDGDDASIHEVRAILNLDPLLTSRVMRVANSAFYGQSGNVPTLDRAVAVLGFRTLRAIAAAACLDQTLTKTGVSKVEADALMRHSLFVAVAARSAAELAARDHVADAFMAGLLHDVGYAAVLVSGTLPPAQRGGAATVGAELHAHALASRRLLERWRLPAALCDAVGDHHASTASQAAGPSQASLADLVRVADRLALESSWTHDGDRLAEQSAGPAADPPRDPVLESALLERVAPEVEQLLESLRAR